MSESKQPLVIHHADCADGFCAAWLFHRAFPDAEFLPARYGDAPPDVTGRRVFVVDFSHPRDVIEAMWASARHLVILDHHKTAAVELSGGFGLDCTTKELPGGGTEIQARRTGPEGTLALGLRIRFDMSKSGGRLAWEYLAEFASGFDGPSPWLVDYTEDRDLWRHELPNSKEVAAAIRSYPFDFALWDEWSERPPSALAGEGIAILRDRKRTVDEHVRHARMITLAGREVPAVNATVLQSEIAGALAVGHPFAACYVDGAAGRTWSLRSAPDGLDVSAIAKEFGGGGHEHAAGFRVLGARYDR